MKDLIEKLKNLASEKGINTKSIKSFIGFALLPIFFAFLLVSMQDLLLNISHIVFFIGVAMLFISMLVVWLMAGLAVFRSLFVVGASMTLLIFISQTYCGLSQNDTVSDDALRYLIGFGVVYVMFTFFAELYKELFGQKDNEEKTENNKKTFFSLIIKSESGATKWVVAISYILFVGWFLSKLYLVLFPIIDNLCVYSG